jgi:NADH-quinone oxidoreductase subunit L
MPWTAGTFLVATLAITGAAPLSGFFSKDAILDGVHRAELNAYPWVPGVVWVIGFVTAWCTAFYMTRLYLLTFEVRPADQTKVAHAHESDWIIRGPLVILAALSVLAAVYGLPVFHTAHGTETLIENYLSTVLRVAAQIARTQGTILFKPEGNLLGTWLLALIIAWAGVGAAAFLYLRYFPSPRRPPVPALARKAVRSARDGFYVDQLYEYLIIRPINFASFVLYKVVDAFLIDTVLVRGTGWVTVRAGSLLRYVQTGNVQSYAAVMALALLGGVAYVVFQVLR